MNPPSDEELIKRCRARDRHAWSLLVGRYGPKVSWAVRHQLRRLNRPDAEADDLFQAVWSRIWSQSLLDRLHDGRCLAGWLVLVAFNEVRTYVRNHTRRGRFTEVPLETSNPASLAEDPSKTPGQAAASSELRQILREEINALDPRRRLILNLYFEEGIRAVRIAERLDLPLNTVLSLIHRIRRKMKDALRKRGIDPL